MSDPTSTTPAHPTSEQWDKLESVFRVVFNDPKLEIREDLSAADVASWDSFNHVNLIITIEAEFGIQFAPTEVADMKNLGDLGRLIAEKTS